MKECRYCESRHYCLRSRAECAMDTQTGNPQIGWLDLMKAIVLQPKSADDDTEWLQYLKEELRSWGIDKIQEP